MHTHDRSCMSGELDKKEMHRRPAHPCVGGKGRRTVISTVEEAVQALAPLDTTLEEMRDRLPSSDPSFRHRMKTFMDELLLVRVLCFWQGNDVFFCIVGFWCVSVCVIFFVWVFFLTVPSSMA